MGTARQAYEIGAALETHRTRIPCVGFDNTWQPSGPFSKKNLVSAVIDQKRLSAGVTLAVRASLRNHRSPAAGSPARP